MLDDDAKTLLKNYHWPGNIRELKNIAEQLSVLSESNLVGAQEIISLVPDIRTRHLPSIAGGPSPGTGGGESFQEREILYKVLFDMKNDLNDLKSLVHDLIQTNDLEIEGGQSWTPSAVSLPDSWNPGAEAKEEIEDSTPYIIHKQDEPEDVLILEDNLSLEEMEKVMIKKALDKHNGRRKDAAEDLGISERTLYRKINQYEI